VSGDLTRGDEFRTADLPVPEFGASSKNADPDQLRMAYRERAQLIAVLAAAYPAVLSTDAAEPDRPDVVYIRTLRGQMSWHLAAADATEFFPHVPRVAPDHPSARWDGHTTPDKYARLQRLVSDINSEVSSAVAPARAVRT